MKLPDRVVRIGGMAFDRLYSNLIFFSSLPFVEAGNRAQAQFDGLTASLFFVVALFAAAFFASLQRVESVLGDKRILAAASIAASIGAVSMMPGIGEAIPTVVSGALVGIGSSILLIAWLDTFSKGSISGTLTEVGMASALSFAISLALSFTGKTALLLTMVICPLLSCAFYLASRTSDRPATFRIRRSPSAQGRKLEMRNLICMFLFGFAVGVMRNYSASHTFGMDSAVLDAILSLSGLAICVAVVILSRLANVGAARFLYRASFVGILMSCVLMAAGRENIIMAVSIAFIAMQCFSCCLIARAMLSSWALGGSVLEKNVSTFGMLYAGEFLGIASAIVLVPITSVMQVCTVLAGALLIAYVFFFTEADFILISKKAEPTTNDAATITGSGPFANAEIDLITRSADVPGQERVNLNDEQVLRSSKEEISLEEVCEAMSAEFGLTPRESEILPGVARGRTIARIQEELFISASTVNTHIRHIYAKCGVSNRQELLDFVDDRRRPQRS